MFHHLVPVLMSRADLRVLLNFLVSFVMYTKICLSGQPYMSLVMRNRLFAYAKTKAQISFVVTAKLISAFVFATQIVQSIHFLNPKFQAYSHFLWLYSQVCVGPGRKPRRPVLSQQGSYMFHHLVPVLMSRADLRVLLNCLVSLVMYTKTCLSGHLCLAKVQKFYK